ncbi:MAG TPA: hypothetical protein ENH26_01810 [Candidatus Wolfebacteria bacterium]|nr:hypothetical protein [Candidatus Wolfebacteria bacterium]
MSKDLFKNLKDLQSIGPNKEYTERSRFLILSSSRYEARVRKINPFVVMAISGAFILITIFSVSYINQILSPIFLPGLNQNDLVAEANEITVSIQVKLDDVKYNIQELEDNNLADLATLNKLKVLLVEATNRLQEASVLDFEGENMELSLQKMKSANEILKEMSLEIGGVLK